MSQLEPIEEAAKRADRRFAVGALVLLLVASIGVFLALNFAAEERERELRAWQVRLSIVADSRFAAVNDWLRRQEDELTALADNASLQLYMSQLVAAADETERQFLAETQGEFLRNLLIVTAARAGFAAPPEGPEVAANVERIGVAGLALVDRAGRVVVATPGLPPIEGALAQFLAEAPPGRRAIMDMFLNQAGRAAMAFVAPVFAVQSDPEAASDIGLVLGVKETAEELYPLLRQPGETSASAEAVLVRRNGAAVEYLSPLKDGTAPLTFTMAADTPGLDAAFALANPGGFAAATERGGRAVLVAARGFAAVPWVLMYEIDRDEALADSEARLQRLLVIFLLAATLAGALIAALWRHANSRRAAEAAARFQQLARRFEGQRNLLGLVTDSQPTAIYILDSDGRYRFANIQAARAAGIPAEDMIGKPIANVVGPEAAERVLALNRQALEQDRQVTRSARLEAAGKVRVVQSDHIPVGAASGIPGVLVVESDITEAVTERERRARTLDRLVETLVSVVDRRDPHAAGHSASVAMIARAIAAEMGLGPTETDAAETAGRLLNLGKILVPSELLTRAAGLSQTERQRVREGILASAELLDGIEFDGPVVDTLRQAQAHWDGTGIPAGLAGEGILVTARVVAVANAFVGMTSPRAHRDALDVDGAVANLLAEANRAYDRRAVVALVNYLDNRGGRERWAEAQRRPPAT